MMKKNNFYPEANLVLCSINSNSSVSFFNYLLFKKYTKIKYFLTFVFILFVQTTISAQALAGNYVISSSNTDVNFKTLAAAVSKINSVGVSSQVTFLLDQDQTVTSQIEIKNFSGSSVTNTLTIKPNVGKNINITANNPNRYTGVAAVLFFNGASNVVIDGSNNASFTQNLTVINDDNVSYVDRSVVWVANNGLLGSSNITIKNSILKFSNRNDGSNQLSAVYSGSNQIGGNNSLNVQAATASNSNISIINNTITNVKDAVYINGGANSSISPSGWKIQNNTIGSTTDSDKPLRGIYLSNALNYEISGNIIAGIKNTLNQGNDTAAILSLGTSSGSIFSNKISDIANAVYNNGQFTAGIFVKSTGSTSIYNNFISNVYVTTADSNNYNYHNKGQGIFVTSGNTVNIYYNTVVMNGAPSGTAYTSCVYTTGGSVINIKSNIFVNSLSGTQYAVFNDGGTISSISYNDYYVTNATNNFSNRIGGTTYSGSSGFSSWNTVVGDTGSKNVLPAFISSNDLHLQSVSANDGLQGVLIPDIKSDIDGDSRVKPYIGADEICSPLVASVSISVPSNVICAGADAPLTFTATPTNGGTSPSYQWQVNKVNAGTNSDTFTISTLNPGDIVTVVMTAAATPCLSGSPATSNEIKLMSQTTVYDHKKWSIPPAANLSAEIRSEYSSESMNLKVCSLVVTDNAAVVIKSGDYVEIQNNLTVEPGSTLLLKSDANLIQINKNAKNSGNITAERQITALKNSTSAVDYVYWSSPVSGQKTKGTDGFSPGTPNGRFYSYRESNDRFYETADATFTPGKGYAVRAEDGKGTQYDKIYSFTGLPNNGDISVPITRSSNDADGTVHGYNMVGNPYPSNISFDELYKGNSGLIYNTAYFWTNFSYQQYQQGSSYGGNNYAVYNATGGNPAATPFGRPANVTGAIKVGQGFIIQKRTIGSDVLNFKNSFSAGHDLRVNASGTFFQKNASTKDRFWLNLTSPSETTNTQLIGYVDGGTNGYEQDFDAEAFDNYADLFYSVLSDKKLVIQGRGSHFTEDDTVQLGANFYQNGTYTISLQNAEGIFKDEQMVYLKDKVANITTNLSQGSYSFQTSKGNMNDRFEIVYQPESVLATSNIVKKTLQVYRNEQDFVISSPQQIISNVEVYDASGRLLYKISPSKNEVILPANALAKGILILKINLKNGEITTRKIRI